MALVFPNTRKEIDSRIKADIQTELKLSDPFLSESPLSALASGNAGRIFENYVQIQEGINQCFVQTAEGDFLALKGAERGITRNPASQSNGFITASGLNGTVIPVSTEFTSNSDNSIVSTAAASIVTSDFDIFSLTRSGNIVTVKTVSDDHQLASNVVVKIEGASDNDYNGSFIIAVISLNQFTYNIDTTPLSPATGTLSYEATIASVPVESITFGDSSNSEGGTQFNFDTPIAGADPSATAQYLGLSGGADIESDRDFRIRISEAYQNPNTPFNANNIIRLAKTVPGVTRVFVTEPTRSSIRPEPGQVLVRFVRDNDANPIPDNQEIATVKSLLLTIKDATTAEDNIIMDPPVSKSIDFQFISLVPNTQTMKNAVRDSLTAFFIDETTLGQDISEDSYKCAIFSSTDPQTGDTVSYFTLLTPIGDISILEDQIPFLGTVIF